MENSFTIDSSNSTSYIKICDYLLSELKPILDEKRNIVFLCIGTDRSTGDCLGPLIGYKLQFLSYDNIHICGNLKNPIHSKNLVQRIDEINLKFNNPFIIAIDSCLGKINNIGKIFIDKKPLYPGKALNKDLPAVGDISITGIVNISSNFDFLVLQNTRLYTVSMIADIISKAIYHFTLKLKSANNYTSNNHIISFPNNYS
ncbi:UNVERIFIED_ORG: spore protease YyaC [Clostridium botulinum]|uniref:Spore protease YyaC n=1 Tax=Clostridium botulinum TaxID=1491 RepID=A0A6B4JR33_CLOBO|nr:spore protease YyaC [Clostridium botulinum]ACD54097.1 putative sporulation protein YyaC [Clostridium botulinum E3 str. Alaska E43]AJF31124.1 sporulation protein [Clostridium botulinum]AJF34186.1 sporulation protein [Clostridium botulinum]EES47915.1 putative sporulation protein YyaC [Clostridium botulinum E1 str. 'BoNT E Beluga']MBY6762710.1 spore protease YyaC [Clostridium botulinum]